MAMIKVVMAKTVTARVKALAVLVAPVAEVAVPVGTVHPVSAMAAVAVFLEVAVALLAVKVLLNLPVVAVMLVPARATVVASVAMMALISHAKHKITNRAKIRIKRAVAVQKHLSKRVNLLQHSLQIRIAIRMAMPMARRKAAIR